MVAAHQITPNLKMRITTLSFCNKRNFLIVGSREGVVMVFEMGKVGRVF